MPQDLARAATTLFVAMNVLPILPLVAAMAADLPQRRRTRAVLGVYAAGLLVALGVTLGGNVVLDLLGIHLDDLRVAGGLVLLVFAIHDLLFSTATRKQPAADAVADDHELAVVPLGIPILVGPAGIATLLVTREAQGLVPTLASLGAVAAFNALALALGPRLLQVMGTPVLRATGKVMSLFLAALAVAMLRAGLSGT